METASCCVQSPQTPIRRLQQDPLFLGLGMASPPQWEGKIVTFNRSLLHTAKSLQSCLTLCNPIDGSPPGSPIPGILQARTLEWVAVSFSNAWKRKVKVKLLSRVWPPATPWTEPTRLLCPWDFPGKSTGVGCHCLLRGPWLLNSNLMKGGTPCSMCPQRTGSKPVSSEFSSI